MRPDLEARYRANHDLPPKEQPAKPRKVKTPPETPAEKPLVELHGEVIRPLEMDAPIGRRQSNLMWREALVRALKRPVKGHGHPEALERIANKVVALACRGDTDAIKEISQRLDGKPMQPTELTVTKITQVPDGELERRIAERLGQIGLRLADARGPSGLAQGSGGVDAPAEQEEVRSKPH